MNAVTHLEKVIVGEVSAVTHLEKVIAGETSAVTYTEKVITGEAPPITHLQKVITGVESPVTHLEYIWAGGSPTPTEHEYTGAVPYTFTANGSPLVSWRISGNTDQNATPTPDHPIMPQGTGERTGNLWNEDYADISSTFQYKSIYVGSGSFTLSTTTPYDLKVANIFLLSGDVTSGASTLKNGVWLNHNVTAQSDSGYITIAYRHYANTTSPVDCKTMLNSGSTALPYEPYGYKIPILSANTTTPVYLGEVETTRRVKKLVLTGQEGWLTSQENYYISVANYYNLYDIGTNITICSHFENRQELVVPDGYYGLGGLLDGNTNTKWNGNIVFNPKPLITTKQDWMNYLAAQYAAGTPVTVWYVLATPETTVVNEPLMKIGDYADEVSNVATIPTVNGSNTIDVDTTVKPSEVYIKYKGV